MEQLNKTKSLSKLITTCYCVDKCVNDLYL